MTGRRHIIAAVRNKLYSPITPHIFNIPPPQSLPHLIPQMYTYTQILAVKSPAEWGGGSTTSICAQSLRAWRTFFLPSLKLLKHNAS